MLRQLVVLLPVLLAISCGETIVPPLTGDPLNPELYRAQIVAVDAVVFEDGPLGEAGRNEVSKTLLDLAKKIGAVPENRIAKMHARELETIGSSVKSTSATNPAAAAALRQQWLRIRASLFDDAAWFRRSSADPIEPAVAPPPPPSALRPATAGERDALDQALATVASVIERAKSDLANANDSDARVQFGADAKRELTTVAEQLGQVPAGYGIDPSFRTACIHAAEAIKNLQILAG